MDIYCQALMSKRLTNRINKRICGIRGGEERMSSGLPGRQRSKWFKSASSPVKMFPKPLFTRVSGLFLLFILPLFGRGIFHCCGRVVDKTKSACRFFCVALFLLRRINNAFEVDCFNSFSQTFNIFMGVDIVGDVSGGVTEKTLSVKLIRSGALQKRCKSMASIVWR